MCFGPLPGVQPSTFIHMPCWDFGKNCTHTISITFSFFKNGNLLEALHLDELFDAEVQLIGETAESVFTFPSRSFSYIEDNVQYWLNIPKQNVQTIDSENGVFILKDIYLSRNKIFDNN